jgi:methylglyoxal synthase
MNNIINKKTAKRIAIVADDNKRTSLIEWSYFNKEVLAQHELTAISETAEILEGTLKIPVKKLFSRYTGGYEQLAALMEAKEVDILFFFAEPAIEKDKDNDLKKLLVLAAKYNVMIACNDITTDVLMRTVLIKKEQETQAPGRRGFIKQILPFINRAAF